MSRPATLLLIVALWAALYLPFLGSLEIRGEEGKRVMPAVQMLESGNYLVPHLGAHPYLNKPPLLNWLVAATFRASGIRNEWTARLPSALFVLLVALVFVELARSRLGPGGSLAAAVSWLTTFELVAKGRTIETDSINASLFALALISWLTIGNGNRLAWIKFTIPWFFLGLGCLTKGPGLLLFFYCVALAVAWRTGRLREFLQPAHWAGLLCMVLIFSAWAVPFFLKVNSSSLGQTWSHEFSAILFGEKGRSENWALNFPRAIAYFLPCVLLLPFLRFHKIDDSSERETARGLLLGSLVPFVVVLLLPGSVPRYVLPLAAPLSWLVGVASARHAFDDKMGNFHFPRILTRSAIAVVIVAEILIFSARAASEARTHRVLQPAAAQINAAIADKEPVYAIGLRYEPYLFYVHAPVFYLSSLPELSREARFFLIPSKDLLKLQSSERWSPLQPRLLARTNLFRSNDTMLFEVTNRISDSNK